MMNVGCASPVVAMSRKSDSASLIRIGLSFLE